MTRTLKRKFIWSGDGQTGAPGGPSLPFLRGDDDRDNAESEAVHQVPAEDGVGKGRDQAGQKESGEVE